MPTHWEEFTPYETGRARWHIVSAIDSALARVVRYPGSDAATKISVQVTVNGHVIDDIGVHISERLTTDVA